jgi:hypothetical protein
MESLKEIDRLFEALQSKDDKIRYPAFKRLLEITENPVDWVYDKWYPLTEKLHSDNSYQRTIGFILLVNLSKSDKEGRIVDLLMDLLEFTDDEKFITARQAIQNIWKIPAGHVELEMKVIQHLENAWLENVHLVTHGNLIKQDIIVSLNTIYKANGKGAIKELITKLINQETDDKFIKKLKQLTK